MTVTGAARLTIGTIGVAILAVAFALVFLPLIGLSLCVRAFAGRRTLGDEINRMWRASGPWR